MPSRPTLMPADTPETGDAAYTITQDGMEVAFGSGPLPGIIAEAQHVASMYAQDGPVMLSLRRVRKRRGRADA